MSSPRKRNLTKAAKLVAFPVNLLLFILMRSVLVRVPWWQVRARGYPGPDPEQSLPESVDSAQAESLFKIGQEDSAATDDKVKQLLALSASLATIALVFGRDTRPPWLFACLVAALVAVVFLCVSVFEVGTITRPTAEDNTTEKHKQWGRDVLRSYYANRATHNFRTDEYRAAHRYFRLALLSLILLAVLAERKPDLSREIAQALQRIEHLGLRLRESSTPGGDVRSTPITTGWRDLGAIPNIRSAASFVVVGNDVLVGTNDGVWRRALMSGHWMRSGLAGIDIRVLRSWSSPGSQLADVIFAGGDPGHLAGALPFHWSPDGGRTWNGTANGLQEAGTGRSIPVADLALQPLGRVGQLPILYAAMSGTTIARSLDGGRNWRYVVGSPTFQATYDCYLHIAAGEPTLLYHGCEAPLDFAWVAAYELSSQATESFGPRFIIAPGGSDGIGNRRPNGFTQSNVDPTVVYCGLEGGVIVLHKREWTWVWRGPSPDGRYTYVRTIWVDPDNPRHRLFGGGRTSSDPKRVGLLETYDGGETVAVADTNLGIDFGKVAVSAGGTVGPSGDVPMFVIQTEDGVRVIIKDRVSARARP